MDSASCFIYIKQVGHDRMEDWILEKQVWCGDEVITVSAGRM